MELRVVCSCYAYHSRPQKSLYNAKHIFGHINSTFVGNQNIPLFSKIQKKVQFFQFELPASLCFFSTKINFFFLIAIFSNFRALSAQARLCHRFQWGRIGIVRSKKNIYIKRPEKSLRNTIAYHLQAHQNTTNTPRNLQQYILLVLIHIFMVYFQIL